MDSPFYSISMAFGYWEDWQPRQEGCALYQVYLFNRLLPGQERESHGVMSSRSSLSK